MLLWMVTVFLFEEKQTSCLHNKASWHGMRYICVVYEQCYLASPLSPRKVASVSSFFFFFFNIFVLFNGFCFSLCAATSILPRSIHLYHFDLTQVENGIIQIPMFQKYRNGPNGALAVTRLSTLAQSSSRFPAMSSTQVPAFLVWPLLFFAHLNLE